MTDAPVTTRELLARCLSSGRLLIGEVLLAQDFTLRHIADSEVDNLELFTNPVDARSIARNDAKGQFRPLKSAPNLRRGWLLETGSLMGMELALDFSYPSALGLWLSWLKGSLQPTPLRETLSRQTGMYRITQLLTGEQVGVLLGRCCNTERGCLRTILWEKGTDVPHDTLPPLKFSLESLEEDRIPLICREVCNLVIAAARPLAKENLPKEKQK